MRKQERIKRAMYEMRDIKLYDYQKYCIERIINDKAVGLFLDMGLGKTLITLTSIKELIYNRFEVDKVLVIAPKKVAEATWQDECTKWESLSGLRISTVLGGEQQRIKALNTKADIYIINRDNVVWLVDLYKNSWDFDMVVIDEFSSFKNHTSKRFKALASIRTHIKRLVGLTGTPTPNGMLDIWSQVYLLDLGERLGRSFYNFRTVFFNSDYMRYNYELRENAEDEILSRISDICISLKAKDYINIPEAVVDIIPVVLNTKAERAYTELEREAVLKLENENEIDATSAAALSNKLLQLANGAVYDEDKQYHEIHSCKIDAFMETLEKLNGKAVLVFYNYKHDLERLKKALSKTKLRVRKLESADEQRDWNNKQIDVLLAHPASAAYGLNLQRGGNHIIWFGLNWNYELYTQANARLHRQGQDETVIIHHLVTKNTRDEDVIEALKRKEGVQDYILESLKRRIQKIKASVG